MNVIWWNMGYPFFRHWWKQIRTGKWNCFFVPINSSRVRSWIESSRADTFFGCEVVSVEDANALYRNTDAYHDWVHSEGHTHGRIILSSVTIQKRVIPDQVLTTEWYDVGECYIAPVHLHWCRPGIRLAQVTALVGASQTLDKPTIIMGDFNIWMIFGKYFLFQKDREAYELLSQHFVEASRNIVRTMIIPWVKLDYVFISGLLANKVKVHTMKRPISGTDHLPLVINIETNEGCL